MIAADRGVVSVTLSPADSSESSIIYAFIEGRIDVFFV